MKTSILRIRLVFFVVAIPILLLACNNEDSLDFRDKYLPLPLESGFKMDGYWVWGGSLIRVEDTYHLFASRWPKKNKFPDDYFVESEIVHATADSPMGPFTFQEVIIGERDSSYWDSNMSHNPTIHKIGDEFVLFYIGSDFTTLRADKKLLRRIGYATASHISGPWKRSETPIINEESNNPAILFETEKITLLYRDENLKIKLATAKNYKGAYQVLNDNVWHIARLEDFYLFKHNGKYHFICEDNQGVATGHSRWGANFVSENGIDNWHMYDPVIVYDHDIVYDNGDTLHCIRRERPQLLIEENKITYLLNGVYDGENSWCQPVQLNPQIVLKGE